MDLSRYRGGGPTAPRSQSTEQTTSLTGWILGDRGRPPAPTGKPKSDTARVIVILLVALTVMVVVAVGAVYLALQWMKACC